MPPPKVRARVRVCYATLLTADDEQLMRCSRCKGARYATRALQKAHWPIHKLVCRPCDPAAGEGKSFEEVHRLVAENLQRGGDADLAALLKRLMHLWTHQEDDAGMDVAERQLHALARGLIFAEEGELYSENLWACPGMPEFLLGGEDLLSPLERLKADYFPLGAPSLMMAEMVLQGEQQAMARMQ